MNGTTRSAAMWLGIVGTVMGAVAIVAAVSGDIRVALGWGVAVAGVSLFVLLIGAIAAPYRPMTAGVVMIVGALGILVGQWPEISQWTVDLWTAATGGPVTYVHEGVTYTPDVWGVLFGSVSILGYVGAILLGAAGAIVATFAPEPEIVEAMPARRPAAI